MSGTLLRLEIDENIRAAYRRQWQGDRSALTTVRGEIGWPKYTVARRGAAPVLTRAKEYSWSAAREEEILERSGHLSAAAIRCRFARVPVIGGRVPPFN